MNWMLKFALLAALAAMIYFALDNFLYLFLFAYGRWWFMGAFLLLALYAIVIGGAIRIVAAVMRPRLEHQRSDDLRFRSPK